MRTASSGASGSYLDRGGKNLEALDLFDDVVDLGDRLVQRRHTVSRPPFFDVVQHVLGVGQPRRERLESLGEDAPPGRRLRQRRAPFLHPPTDRRPADPERLQLLLHRRVRCHTPHTRPAVRVYRSCSSKCRRVRTLTKFRS